MNSKSKPDNVLVYSTDGPVQKRCGGCQRPINECRCGDKPLPSELKPVVRFERKGRGGKTVTIVERLPAHETLLKELCGFLKKSLGSGGTHYTEKGEGFIEIQGDRVNAVKELITKFQAKHAASKGG